MSKAEQLGAPNWLDPNFVAATAPPDITAEQAVDLFFHSGVPEVTNYYGRLYTDVRRSVAKQLAEEHFPGLFGQQATLDTIPRPRPTLYIPTIMPKGERPRTRVNC